MSHKPIINPERTASHRLRAESRRSGRREGLLHRGWDRAGRLSAGAERRLRNRKPGRVLRWEKTRQPQADGFSPDCR